LAPFVDKRFFARTDDDQTRYVEGFVELNCGLVGDIRLTLGRQHMAAAAAGNALFSTFSVSAGGRRIDLTHQASSQTYDMRSSSLTAVEVGLLSSSDAALRLSGSDLARTDDAKGSISLDMRGFSDALAKLRTRCSGVAGDTKVPAAPAIPAGVAATASKAPPGPGSLITSGDRPVAALVEPEKAQSAAQPADTPTRSGLAAPGCEGRIPGGVTHVTGRVVAFFSDEEALQRTQRVQAMLGAQVSTAYASLPRVKVVRSDDSNWSTMAAVPENLTVKVGDLVELNSRHRDQGTPCTFIPWTINRLIDQAQ
jgi:hypothetical protein